MSLKETVNGRVSFVGKTPGGCLLAIHHLLDAKRDVFQFMQLFNEEAIEEFYYAYAREIDELCAEDDDVLSEDANMEEGTKYALEKTLMVIEDEIKNAKRD